MTRARDLANLIGSGNYSSTTFTATAGQTAFTISHTQGFVQVFMNGLLLDETVDYTSNGTAITLTSAASAGDEIEVVAYNTFSVGDAQTQTQADARYYTQSAADTRYANVAGDTFTGDTVFSTTTQVPLRVENTAANNLGSYIKIRDGNSTAGQHTWIGRSADGTYMYSNNNDLALSFTNAGQVKMQNQPGFSYLGSKSYVISGTGTVAMSSSNVWASNVNHAFNRGSHFNASTGRFTCPIAGRYQFHFRCQASNFGSGYLWFYMRLNQSVFSYAQKSQENAHTMMYLGGILELNANDYVDVAWTNNYVSGQIHYPEFTGMLIG